VKRYVNRILCRLRFVDEKSYLNFTRTQSREMPARRGVPLMPSDVPCAPRSSKARESERRIHRVRI